MSSVLKFDLLRQSENRPGRLLPADANESMWREYDNDSVEPHAQFDTRKGSFARVGRPETVTEYGPHFRGQWRQNEPG